MLTKMFEIRDEGTMIPVIALWLGDENLVAENWLLARAGWDSNPIERMRHDYVILIQIAGGVKGTAQNSPADWPDSGRTMREAHIYIKENFHELKTGDVVDIQFILGEHELSVISERLEEAT